MNKPTSNRCAACDTNWPALASYKTCPMCLDPTFVAADEQPLDFQEATRLVKAHEAAAARRDRFEEYYANRETAKLAAEIEQWGVQADKLGR